MLKISREVDLGLLLMAELYEKKSLSLSEWAKEKKLPYRFLSKIAVKLKKAGLIKSREGREGGYWLNKKVKVGEIFKAIEGKKGVVACLQGQTCAAAKFCHQRKVLVKLNQVLEKQLNQMNLEELC
ncbi:MAG: Rrf2 family transcriptional regulator [Candidatus Beckwithbacteria bacterium]|nr:Rrf2 family transcriptional regulator [Candidatus Beckwithbacteria bacterium]